MPYIKSKRPMVCGIIKESSDPIDLEYVCPETSGELNYSFTYLITHYLRTQKLSYKTINDVLGALEGAKLEFYRRVVVPYENQKIRENGDVYPDSIASRIE